MLAAKYIGAALACYFLIANFHNYNQHSWQLDFLILYIFTKNFNFYTHLTFENNFSFQNRNFIYETFLNSLTHEKGSSYLKMSSEENINITCVESSKGKGKCTADTNQKTEVEMEAVKNNATKESNERQSDDNIYHDKSKAKETEIEETATETETKEEIIGFLEGLQSKGDLDLDDRFAGPGCTVRSILNFVEGEKKLGRKNPPNPPVNSPEPSEVGEDTEYQGPTNTPEPKERGILGDIIDAISSCFP